uniref:Uncharacterized protein n=1 Tax=Timema tahoe TaxID=61484 RepID=A0A7R9NZU1_9NEOP|nr:unnamed protein product [Timema tahoe]
MWIETPSRRFSVVRQSYLSTRSETYSGRAVLLTCRLYYFNFSLKSNSCTDNFTPNPVSPDAQFLPSPLGSRTGPTSQRGRTKY